MWQLKLLCLYTLFTFVISCYIYLRQKAFYKEMLIPKSSSEKQISIHEEYPEFSRHDKTSFKSIFIGAFFLFWIRFTLVSVIATSCMITLLIKNSKLATPGVVTQSDRPSFKRVIEIHTMLFLYASGIWVISSRPDVSSIYKKYFGPDYKIEYDSGYSAIISNHTCFIDILVCMNKFGAGFISKADVKKTPIIGSIATSLQSLFLDRENSKDRETTFHNIKERQSNYMNGTNMTPLVIFPEGTTTSGRHLMPFRKGAFASLLPLKPVIFNGRKDPNFFLSCGASNVFVNYMRGLTKLFTVFEVKEIPIIQPTEYMLEQYKDYSQEKWEIYSKVTRALYCEIEGFKTTERTLKDSRRYRKSIQKGKYLEDHLD